MKFLKNLFKKEKVVTIRATLVPEKTRYACICEEINAGKIISGFCTKHRTSWV